MSRYLVYALADPRSGATFWVGKSTSGLSRPRAHGSLSGLRDADRTNRAKAHTIRELQALGLSYRIEVLESLPEPERAADVASRLPFGIALGEAERKWIAFGRAEGWPLLNRTLGGENVVGPTAGVSPSTETRAKLSAALMGRPKSLEHRAAISLGKRGRKPTEEARKHQSLAHLGKKLGKQRPEVVAARAARQTGRPGKIPSEESRAKMRVSAIAAWERRKSAVDAGQ